MTAMGEHLITLRAAKPSYEEGLVFERYLNQAAEGFFRFLFGRRASDIIATAYTHPDHDFSYENVTFAEDSNTIVGMVSGFSFDQHELSTEELLAPHLRAFFQILRIWYTTLA